MIILGAGASADANATGYDNYDFRPPLANELFTRPALVRSIFPVYRALSGITYGLTHIPDGVTVEEEINKLNQRAVSGYIPASREVASIILYLRRALHACTTGALGYGRGTTHAEFVRRLDDWADQSGWRICVVTFNYDTILEEALADMGVAFTSIDDYVDRDPRWTLLKLHGSWNWARELDDPRYLKVQGPRERPNVNEMRLIDDYHDLKVSSRFHVHGVDPTSPEANFVELPKDESVPTFPAIALPLTEKSEFVCPASHRAALAKASARTKMLITIGWRGQEKHFLKELHFAEEVRTLIVTRSSAGGVEVQRRLGGAGVTGSFELRTGGFLAYLRDDAVLEAFLGKRSG